MVTRIALACFSCLLLLAIQALYLPAKSQSYKQNAQRLEKQFDPFLKAAEKGDKQAQDEAFNVFRLPNENHWFGEYFSADSVEQLGWDADAEVDGEKNRLLRFMSMLDRGARFRSHCKPFVGSEAVTVKPRESSIHPLKPVPVEQFEVELQSERSGKKFSFLGNFVYVEGAYRYVGKGAFPFWAIPDANDPAKR